MGTCKEYFSSIVKGLSKIAFHHFKHLCLGSISFSLIHCVSWTCKIVTIKSNYELLFSQVKISFKSSCAGFCSTMWIGNRGKISSSTLSYVSTLYPLSHTLRCWCKGQLSLNVHQLQVSFRLLPFQFSEYLDLASISLYCGNLHIDESLDPLFSYTYRNSYSSSYSYIYSSCI